MDVAQVLVVGEIYQVVGFAADRYFSCFGDLEDYVVSGSFDDSEGEDAADEAGLELVGAHFDDHVLDSVNCTW